MNAKVIVNTLLEADSIDSLDPDDLPSKEHIIRMGRAGECEELCPHCGAYCTLLHYDLRGEQVPKYHICQTCDLKTVEPGDTDGIERAHVPAMEAVDPDDPGMNLERYAQAMGMQRAAKEQEVLEKFKRSVRAYIKWANPRDEQFWGVDAEDLRALRRAKTFEEAQAILAKWESEPSFLSMIQQGYFV